MKTFNTILYFTGTAFGAFCAYFGIEPIVFLVLSICFVFDFITGMTAARIKKQYDSHKGRIMTLSKMFGILAILIVALIFKVLGIPHEYFTMSAIMILAIHDIISSLSHIYYLRTRKDLGEFDAISMLLKLISDKLKQIAQTILKNE